MFSLTVFVDRNRVAEVQLRVLGLRLLSLLCHLRVVHVEFGVKHSRDNTPNHQITRGGSPFLLVLRECHHRTTATVERSRRATHSRITVLANNGTDIRATDVHESQQTNVRLPWSRRRDTHTLPTRATRCRREIRSCRFSKKRKLDATRDRPIDTVARAILPLATRPRSARVDPVARAASRRRWYSSRRISAPFLFPRPTPLSPPSSSLGGYLQIRRPAWYILYIGTPRIYYNWKIRLILIMYSDRNTNYSDRPISSRYSRCFPMAYHTCVTRVTTLRVTAHRRLNSRHSEVEQVAVRFRIPSLHLYQIRLRESFRSLVSIKHLYISIMRMRTLCNFNH